MNKPQKEFFKGAVLTITLLIIGRLLNETSFFLSFIIILLLVSCDVHLRTINYQLKNINQLKEKEGEKN